MVISLKFDAQVVQLTVALSELSTLECSLVQLVAEACDLNKANSDQGSELASIFAKISKCASKPTTRTTTAGYRGVLLAGEAQSLRRMLSLSAKIGKRSINRSLLQDVYPTLHANMTMKHAQSGSMRRFISLQRCLLELLRQGTTEYNSVYAFARRQLEDQAGSQHSKLITNIQLLTNSNVQGVSETITRDCTKMERY